MGDVLLACEALNALFKMRGQRLEAHGKPPYG
jgi:hypothetical protein